MTAGGASAPRLTRRARSQRQRILAAAASAIAARGYHGMSMRDLAQAAGTSLSNLYNYFPAKEGILFAVQRQAFGALIASAEEVLATVEEPNARLYGFISHHVRYCVDHPDEMRVLVHQASALPAPQRRSIRRLKERYFRIGREILRELMEEGCGIPEAGGPPESEAELDRIAYSLFGMLNWIYGWYEPQVHGAPQKVARSIHRIVICGAVARCPFKEVQDRVDLHLDSLAAPRAPEEAATGGPPP